MWLSSLASLKAFQCSFPLSYRERPLSPMYTPGTLASSSSLHLFPPPPGWHNKQVFWYVTDLLLHWYTSSPSWLHVTQTFFWQGNPSHSLVRGKCLIQKLILQKLILQSNLTFAQQYMEFECGPTQLSLYF